MTDNSPAAPKPFPKDVAEFAIEERTYLHDVANPLAIAAGMLEALVEDFTRAGVQLSESQERKLTKARTAVDRIAGLVKDRRVRMVDLQASLAPKPS